MIKITRMILTPQRRGNNKESYYDNGNLRMDTKNRNTKAAV